MKIAIRNIKIADPAREEAYIGDVYIADGKISAPFSSPDRVIEGEGLVLFPGLVDIHVHLRDPGQTHKEDLLSGAAAAAAGGVTSVVAMPNTLPPMDDPLLLREVLARAAAAPVRIYQAACITKGMQSEALTDFAALKEAGAVAFSDDGLPVGPEALMEEALRQAAALGRPVLSHSEILPLAVGGKVNAGRVSEALGVKGMPAEAEYAAIRREIALSEKTGCPVHICHVSTAESVALVRAAKRRDVRVTCETGPHYFWFTEEAALSLDADYRMNPPLRTAADRQAVLEGLADGTIDCIATDHAPHAPEEKADFAAAPNGVVGLETSLSASYTALVEGEITDLCGLARLMSARPAKIAGIAGGSLAVGAPADLTLFDPAEAWVVRPEELHGKSKNTPFKGVQLHGRVRYTLCRGRVVFDQNAEQHFG